MIEKIKIWLSNKLPKFAKDKADHYIVVRILTWYLAPWGIFFPIPIFWAMSTVFILAILWEIPTLIRDKFSWKACTESFRDFTMAVYAGGLIWLYLLSIK